LAESQGAAGGGSFDLCPSVYFLLMTQFGAAERERVCGEQEEWGDGMDSRDGADRETADNVRGARGRWGSGALGRAVGWWV